MAAATNRRKKWGIILIVWPFASLILAFLLYAIINWFLGAALEPTPSISDGVNAASSDSLFGEPSVFTTIANVILFIVGALAVTLGLPSVIVGIVLLATPGTASVRLTATTPIEASQAYPSQHPAADKKGMSIAGMVLGIVSLVFVWFGGFIPGILAIIFSAIGLKRGRNGMAIAGLVTGILGTVGSLLFILAMITSIAYSNVSERADDSANQSEASIVLKRAEAFNATYGSYPTFLEMQQIADQDDIIVGAEGDESLEDVIYIPCYGDGAIIWYWISASEEFGTFEAGDTSICEWS